jgi:FkbM family methyltransferase
MKKVFIDLGANNGSSIELFLNRIDNSNEFEIHSFECNPQLFEVCKKKFPNLNIYNKGASTYDGKSKFYLGTNPALLASSLRADKTTGNINYDKPIIVEVVDISKFITENFSKDDYIILKMDIEGAEYDILPKMLSEGLFDGYVNELYGEWHNGKLLNVSDEFHNQLISNLSDKGFRMKFWCAATKQIDQ